MTKTEVKEKWVEALRSGKYEQGTGYLCRDGQYCCLGVLCDVLGIDNKDYPHTRGAKTYFVDEDDHSSAFGLPRAALELTHLNSTSGRYQKDNGDFSDLITNNDEQGMSFSDIADIIESEPQGLFNDTERIAC
jgi:hypothetical protein